MDLAELERRLARLNDASVPFGVVGRRVDVYDSEPVGGGEGVALSHLGDGGMAVGFIERGQYSRSHVFDSPGAAFEHVWNDYAKEYARSGAGRPAYSVRALFRPQLRNDRARTTSIEGPHSRLEFDELAADRDPVVRQMIAYHPGCPPDILDRLADDPGCVVLVAENEGTPSSRLAALAAHPDPKVRVAVARNASTTAGTLAELAARNEEAVVLEVARSPRTAGALLGYLAEFSLVPLVRRVVAANPATPPHVLDRLSVDPDFAAGWAVARNPSASPERLASLVSSSDWGVRWGIAGNPSTPEAVLAVLAGDSEMAVRYVLALNPHSPAAVRRVLVGDQNEAVRRSVAQTTAEPDVLERLAVDPVGSVALWVSENPAATDAILEVQARHPDSLARQRARDEIARRAQL